MRTIRAWTDRWIDRPSLDYLLAFALVVIVMVAQPSDPVEQSQRGTWLQTLAMVAGGFLGVAGVAVTLMFTVTPNDRLERVFSSVGPRLSKLVLSGIGGLAAVTVGFTGLFLIEDWPEASRMAATAALAAFGLARLARLWWLVRHITMVLAVPDETGTEASTLAPAEWARPTVGESDYALGSRPGRSEADPSP